MTKRELIAEWETTYGAFVPIEVIREKFAPTALQYLTKTYYFDPIRRVIVRTDDGSVQDGTHISLGGTISPITRSKGEWMLREGTDPWRVGHDPDGRLWAKAGYDSEKTYAA